MPLWACAIDLRFWREDVHNLVNYLSKSFWIEQELIIYDTEESIDYTDCEIDR